MEDNMLERISSKYIIRLLFSHIKIGKSLKIIKINKKLMERIDIKEFHYQLYSLYSSFKYSKIDNINDILNSPKMTLYPDDIKCEVIFRLMKKEKLFQNYNYINIYDQQKISLIIKLINKFNYDFKFIIKDSETPKNNIYEKDEYRNAIKSIISKNKNFAQKILYDSQLFIDDFKNYNDVKYLYNNNLINISLFDNLEYLSISYDLESLKLSENQFKNIKVLKIYESQRKYDKHKDINFVNKKESKPKFQNLEELYIKKKFLNKINFEPNKLKRLNLLFDFRDKIYDCDYIENSINDIIENYSSLVDLTIEFFYISNNSMYYEEFYEKIFNYFFDLEHNLENISFKIYFLWGNIIPELLVTINNKNKTAKIMILDINVDISVLEPLFNNIEEFELLISYSKENNYYNKNNNIILFIDEKNSISKITKLKIKYVGSLYSNLIYIPIKSFSSLNFLKLELYNNSKINFPLFDNSSIKFDNLEYLHIDMDIFSLETIIENIKNIPNLKYLAIISKKNFQTDYPFKKMIISKCVLLKKLGTLIANDHGLVDSGLFYVNKYYDIYPELKKTNIKFCNLSDSKK